jgi:hypothetical protein
MMGFLNIGSRELFAQLALKLKLQTAILLISASQVARITGMSHWHLAGENILNMHK